MYSAYSESVPNRPQIATDDVLTTSKTCPLLILGVHASQSCGGTCVSYNLPTNQEARRHKSNLPTPYVRILSSAPLALLPHNGRGLLFPGYFSARRLNWKPSHMVPSRHPASHNWAIISDEAESGNAWNENHATKEGILSAGAAN